MKPFLVLQHLDVEHPGVLRECMRDEGIGWDTVELDQGEALPSLDGYQALIVMGGPMDVWQEQEYPWLTAEKQFIREAVIERDLPYLGLCLGHQLLAAALGGDVGPAQSAEVGVMQVGLTDAGRTHPFFSGFPDAFDTLQWHSAEVRRVPAGSKILASAPACDIEAFAYGSRALGAQFHIEVTPSTFDDWKSIPAYEASLLDTLGPSGVDRFRADTAAQLETFRALANTLWRNWRSEAFKP